MKGHKTKKSPRPATSTGSMPLNIN